MLFRRSPCFGHDSVGLIAVLIGNLSVRGKDSVGRQDLLSIAGVVRRDLRGLRPGETAAATGLFDLLAARAGGIKILLRVAFDVRRSAPARLDLVAESAELVGEMGLIDGGGELLALERDCAAARPASFRSRARSY